MVKDNNSISPIDREYINLMRGISIARVVLVHLGLSWFFSPYSDFVHVFLPVLFFVSGGVIFFSFKRLPSVKTFLVNRLLAIGIPFFMVVIVSFIVLWVYQQKIPNFDIYSILQWLTINPHAVRDTMPFPLGQVWYLHSLAIIILISPIFFVLSLKSSLFLLIPVLISTTMGVFQHFSEYGRNMIYYGHNMYQPLINMGFFFFGAFYFVNREWFTFQRKVIFFCSFLFFGIVTGIVQPQEMSMARHIYAPDFYYLSCSFAAIFLFLTFQERITWIIEGISPLKWFFLFMSRHSYAVFLIHSLVLVKIHVWFDLANIAGDPIRASIKIFLVMFFTCLLSVPVTRLSNNISKRVKSYIWGSNNSKAIPNALN